MRKSILGENDILHICVPTEQNAINLYSYEYIRTNPRLTYSDGRLFNLLLASKHAVDKEWHNKLKSIFGDKNSKVFKFSEGDSYDIKIKGINEFIANNYLINPAALVFINYGGGLKQFTPVIWALRETFEKCFFLYPDKGLNRMTLAEFYKGNAIGETVEKLELNITSDEYLKLFLTKGDRIQKGKSFTTVKSEDQSQRSEDDFYNALMNVPCLYSSDTLTDLLYELSSGLNVGNIENLSFAEVLSRIKDDKDYRNKIHTNIRSGFKFVDYSITEDFKLNYSKNIPNLPDILNNIKWCFWNLKNYIADHSIELKTSQMDELYLLGLNIDIEEEKIADKPVFVTKLFSTDSLKVLKIDSHSKYFEYLCLNIILKWAHQHPNLIREVAYDVKITKAKPSDLGTQDYMQTDIMIYTKSGTIYFVECKTFKFENSDFLAAIKKIEDLGGFFNSYLIVLPPMPSQSNSNQRKIFQAIYDQYMIMSAGYRNVSCCQFAQTNSDKTIFPTLQSKLDSIIRNEMK